MGRSGRTTHEGTIFFKMETIRLTNSYMRKKMPINGLGRAPL